MNEASQQITVEHVQLLCTFVLQTAIGVMLWHRYQGITTTEGLNSEANERGDSHEHRCIAVADRGITN
ncbi:MAG: hypothetical protein M3447_03290 [Acidobacteriota bacterium]|nr:hypothetical protein [Acidobacteriota bacterium]